MFKFTAFLLLSTLILSFQLRAQDINQLRNRLNGLNSASGKSQKDSLVHRNPLEDSITISYRYFDSTRPNKIDSSISDWYRRFPIPASYDYLGNLGQAAKSLIFTQNMKPGFDAGFHAFDAYNYTIAGTRIFQTTRPYTELAYMIGNSAEQMANVLHTQNRKNNFNFTFEYRFITSPGAFKNQSSSHNNIRLSTFYQSRNKRYGMYFIYMNNKHKVSQNGGIQADSSLEKLTLGSPIGVNVRIGNSIRTAVSNTFNTVVQIGNEYRESVLYLRHYYDFGQKDSIVQDSSTIRLFYPRLRLQHSLSYSSYTYNYRDVLLDSTSYINYFKYYGANNKDSLYFNDRWRDLTNEFSIITFPDKKNVAQFLRLSADLQILSGTFSNNTSRQYTNVYASAEYRNRTKNQKWDIEALGQLYLTGGFIGDYTGYISLQRQLSKKLGSLQIGFQNTNKSPTQAFQAVTSFPVLPEGAFSKTNISKAFANLYLPSQKLHLYGNYYAVTNYMYLDDYYTAKQQSGLFNYLVVGLEKTFRLAKHFNWYTEATFQQSAGNAPVHLPLVYTRNRIAFEGNFFKNLYLSTGFDIRYFTPYKADGYSPLNGQFYYQSDSTLTNRPDIAFYLNFRIKSFKTFIRLENLNTLDKYGDSFGFVYRNFSAPHYPQNTLWLRLGIWWNFVN